MTGKTILPPGTSAHAGSRDVYDRYLADRLHQAAVTIGVPVRRGVYAGGLGPSYETSAEIRMLRRIGADAVGMSTVLEAMAGKRLGIQVAGISVITNLATGISPGRLSHEEVTAGAAAAGQNLKRVLKEFLKGLPAASLNPTQDMVRRRLERTRSAFANQSFMPIIATDFYINASTSIMVASAGR